MEGYGVVKYLTQTQVDAGEGDALVGVRIAIINAQAVPTGTVYESGAAGTAPTQLVTGGNINTVLQASVGAGWEKAQATVANYVITRPASGTGLDLHIETGGTLAALTLANWPIPASGVDQLRIRNFSAVAQSFTATGFSGVVTADGNAATSGTYSIPVDMAVHITIDEDGWIQVTPMGQEVSQAELDSLTTTVLNHGLSTSNPHSTTKAQLGLGSVDNTADTAKPVSTAQQTALDLKAPLASPTFTGVPLSVTPVVDTNTTQIATTAFVHAQLSGTLPVMNGTATVGSGNRSARGNHVHPTDTSRAPLASPTFTGIPAAPTAVAGTNTTQVATTEFVQTAVSALVDSSPAALDTLNELAAALGDDPNFATTTATAIGLKQATLVSGTNIKTVNGTSLLGAGNMTIAADLPGSSATTAIDDGLVSGNAVIDRTTVAGETILKYTTAGLSTFKVPAGVTSIQALVVAGGAGGGSGVGGDLRGGGGGAGGLLTDASYAVTPGAIISVTVGAGGAAATNGSNSSFDSLVATGGGRGGSGAQAGAAGGSGGGGGAPSGGAASNAGGGGTAGQGNDGGVGGTDGATYRNGGGGGGASAAGTNASGGTAAGGAGISSSITGVAVTYAGGGGGGGPVAANGGAGGGGRGGAYPAGAATAGTANLGGGGGGGANTTTGAAGGSGVVILRFATQSRTYTALSSYADNAAAITAGLFAGEFYKKTADGSVQQVV